MSNNFTVKQADQPFQPVTITIENQETLDVLIALTRNIGGQPTYTGRSVTDELMRKLTSLKRTTLIPEYFSGALRAIQPDA